MKPNFKLAAVCGLLSLCFACSSVHKVTNKSASHVDSVAVTHSDSVAVNRSTDEHNGIEINDLDVVIDYPNFPSEDTVKPGDSQLIKFIKRTHPKSITIHAGKISDSSTKLTVIDSVSVVKHDSAKVVSAHTNTVRTVDKKGISFGLKVGAIAAIIVLLMFAFVKFNLKRFFPWS